MFTYVRKLSKSGVWCWLECNTVICHYHLCLAMMHEAWLSTTRKFWVWLEKRYCNPTWRVFAFYGELSTRVDLYLLHPVCFIYYLLHVIFCMVSNCKSIHENSTFSLFYNMFTDYNPLFAAVIILNNYIPSSPSPATANHTQNLNIPLSIIRHPSNCNPTWPLNNWPRLCLYSHTQLILTLNTLWSCEQ